MPAAFARRAASRPSTERSTLSGALCTWMSMAPARSRAAVLPCATRPTAAVSAIDAAMIHLGMAIRRLRQRLIRCRAIEAQLLELLRRVELAPEIERDVRRRRARACQNPIDEAHERAREILRA